MALFIILFKSSRPTLSPLYCSFNNSEKPKILAKGVFNSCAIPAVISPRIVSLPTLSICLLAIASFSLISFRSKKSPISEAI